MDSFFFAIFTRLLIENIGFRKGERDYEEDDFTRN